MRLAWRFFWLTLPLAVLADCSHGAEWHAVAHGFSTHGKRVNGAGDKPHESNHGFGIRAQRDATWAAQIGTYENTYGARSRYALIDWTPADFARGRFGTFGALVDGYPWRGGDWLPVVGLVQRWQAARFGAAIRGGPGKDTGFVVAIEFSVRVR